MATNWTPRTSTVLPAFRWDDATLEWDMLEVYWDSDGWRYRDALDPETHTENYLLINGTDFLSINDAGDKLIISVDSNSIWTTRTQP